MKIRFFDSHCHPQVAAFDEDRAAVLARMEEQGVGGLVVGTDLDKSRKAVELAEKYDFLWAAVGLHPNDSDEEFDDEAFSELARKEKVVAIGECGLDYYRNEPTQEERVRQHARFEKHLALAEATGKPLMIHCRATKGTDGSTSSPQVNAQEEMFAFLAEHPQVRAVMHFFTSSPDIAKRYLELGCYLSFPGVITFTDMYDETVRTTPLDRILSETDAPYAAPAPYRGSRNEPVYVTETVKRLAELKGLSAEDMAVQIRKNASAVFRLGL